MKPRIASEFQWLQINNMGGNNPSIPFPQNMATNNTTMSPWWKTNKKDDY